MLKLERALESRFPVCVVVETFGVLMGPERSDVAGKLATHSHHFGMRPSLALSLSSLVSLKELSSSNNNKVVVVPRERLGPS